MKQVSFYLKLIGNSILKLRLLLLAAKFSEFTCPWDVNYPWRGKLSRKVSCLVHHLAILGATLLELLRKSKGSETPAKLKSQIK